MELEGLRKFIGERFDFPVYDGALPEMFKVGDGNIPVTIPRSVVAEAVVEFFISHSPSLFFADELGIRFSLSKEEETVRVWVIEANNRLYVIVR